MVMDTRHVILNLFQNLSAEKWKDNARGEKLKLRLSERIARYAPDSGKRS